MFFIGSLEAASQEAFYGKARDVSQLSRMSDVLWSLTFLLQVCERNYNFLSFECFIFTSFMDIFHKLTEGDCKRSRMLFILYLLSEKLYYSYILILKLNLWDFKTPIISVKTSPDKWLHWYFQFTVYMLTPSLHKNSVLLSLNTDLAVKWSFPVTQIVGRKTFSSYVTCKGFLIAEYWWKKWSNQ